MNKVIKIDEYFLIRYIWLIIIIPKEIQAIILSGILLVFFIKRKIYKFDVITYLVLMYSLLHLISIYVNINITNFEFNRIIAALNTALSWGVAGMYYTYYKNNALDIKKLEKLCYNNMIILIVLSIFSIILFNLFNFNEFKILGNYLYGMEWFKGKLTLRFGAFMEYANLIVFFYLMFFPLYSSYLINNKSKIKIILYITLSYLPITISLSRSGYIIVGITMIIYVYYIIRKKIDKRLIIFLGCLILSIIVFLSAYHDLITNIVQSVNELIGGREGSNSSRFYLYLESIRLTTIYSPFLGRGVKAIALNGYPLGSHSTYIGFYYKTGILGFILGICIIISINMKMILQKIDKYNYYFIKISLIIMSLMLFVEDLDGENWLIVCYFSFIGILLNKENLINYYK